MKTKKNKVKLVLFGAGVRGQYKYAPYILNNPHEAEFVSVVEPNKERRERFRKKYSIKAQWCFENTNDFFEKKIIADAVLICTQDKLHFRMASEALQNGYHIMLEKPMTTEPDTCIKLDKLAKENNRVIFVCHVLRYFAFFKKIKQIITCGKIGSVISINHSENVGFFHIAHSFVRGSWRNSFESSPIILQKCCHDFDIMIWLIDSNCVNIASFGSLVHFCKKNAPPNAPKRCIDGCPYEEKCPYSAIKIYLKSDLNVFPSNIISPDGKVEEIIEELKKGEYGRCVYQCDNNVVDHQSTILEFENGVTATFSLSGFTHEHARTIRITGTKGEIRGHIKKDIIEIHDFNDNSVESINLKKQGDVNRFGMDDVMTDFIHLLSGGNLSECITSSEKSIHSHMLSFAAEESRKQKRVINISQFTMEFKEKIGE